MRGYLQTTFGDSYAEGFEAKPLRPDPEQAAAVLARYAGAGPALELGIGSGRIARPLAARGIEVDGIEISSAMIEQLNASVAGLPVRAIPGDFTDFEPPRRYSLIYCSFNTFFLLRTPDEQVQTFANVARALDDNGVFIIETSVIPSPRHTHTEQDSFVPNVNRTGVEQEFKIMELTADSVTLQFTLHYPEKQTIENQRVVIDAKGVTLRPFILRFASPGELDEMAAQSGLHLQTRWADWDAEPFTQESPRHVSIYARHIEQDTRESSPTAT